jgi:hypothetical protein
MFLQLHIEILDNLPSQKDPRKNYSEYHNISDLECDKSINLGADISYLFSSVLFLYV